MSLAPRVRRWGLQQPGGLHGQGRGARSHPPADQGRNAGARHRQGIDPAVPEETRVLGPHQPLEERRVGAGEVGADPPAPVLHRQGPQPRPVPIQHHRRGPLRPRQIRRKGGVQGGGDLQGQKGDQADDDAAAAPSPSWSRLPIQDAPAPGRRATRHGAATHVPRAGWGRCAAHRGPHAGRHRRPPAERATTPGWYMSTAWAPGRKKSPGVTARAT